MCRMVLFVFFFFQAEDGIRDIGVTGVQTCALPILQWRMLDVPGMERLTGAGVYYGAAMTEALSCKGEEVYVVGGANSAGQAAMHFRSGERRGGEEGRARGAPYHLKKKTHGIVVGVE